MQRVFVLDKNRQPLMPCKPRRARKLLSSGKAKVYRRYPFTIILTQREERIKQSIEIKVDPGSRTTGITLVAQFSRGNVVIWAANLEHRGQKIQKALTKRRASRRSRRNRKTRYREPKFLNRTKGVGWLAPSLISRVQNVFHWAKKLCCFAPVSQIAVETVRFDMQKLRNPEISGVEYQQGELLGYEVREYLLEKWGRKCAYCDRENVPLEIEHIVSRAKSGSNAISNLTLACEPCNKKKGTKSLREFLVDDPKRLERVLAQAKAPLKDAAAVNAIRYAIGNRLKFLGLPTSFWSGGQTKYNRTRQGYSKDHWIDAACVGKSGEIVIISKMLNPVYILAEGRGARQMCRVDYNGFPRTQSKKAKRIHGFQTGDIVKAIVTKGKKIGTYIGRVAIRTRGIFNIKIAKSIIKDINYRNCRCLHHIDGYSYSQRKDAISFPS